jgi:broad specificity phosphatase PhoE
VRHGAKEKVPGDPGLTPEGVRQAALTASFFRSMPIGSVFASPLRRARETAAVIADALSLSGQVDARLRERADWGDLPGQPFEEFAAMWERATRDRHWTPPVGDSASTTGERIAAFVRDCESRHTGDVVAVTHGGAITDFLVSALPEVELNRWHPDFVQYQALLVPECSITTVVCCGVQISLTEFANTDHLRSPDESIAT